MPWPGTFASWTGVMFTDFGFSPSTWPLCPGLELTLALYFFQSDPWHISSCSLNIQLVYHWEQNSFFFLGGLYLEKVIHRVSKKRHKYGEEKGRPRGTGGSNPLQTLELGSGISQWKVQKSRVWFILRNNFLYNITYSKLIWLSAKPMESDSPRFKSQFCHVLDASLWTSFPETQFKFPLNGDKKCLFHWIIWDSLPKELSIVPGTELVFNKL